MSTSTGISTSKKVQGPIELDSDATIAGFVLQQHLTRLLSFFTSSRGITRHSALTLIGTLLRQGMLCPLDVIGHIIALLGETEMIEIKQDALLILQLEDEKYSSFLDNRVIEGVELSYYFRSKLMLKNKATDTTTTTTTNSPIADPIYEYYDEFTSSVNFCSIFSELYLSCYQSVFKTHTHTHKHTLTLQYIILSSS